MAGFNNATDFYPRITGQLTIYPGPINQVTATVDNNVGTPHVDVQTEYTADGMNINFDFHDMGIPGTDLTVLQPLTEQQKANARQNINAQEVLTFDSAPTQGSQNPVTSGGVYAAEQAIAADVADIEAVIPAAATSQNQLADKEYVDDSINRSSAFFRGNFETRAALMAVPWQTTNPDAPNYVSNNDYAYVADDETHDDESWRYIYVLEEGGSNNGWAAQYRVNESPLTTEQLAALNSGITSAGVAQIETNRTGLASHVADHSNPHQVTKAQVGLGNVDNTSDADKPVSTAQQAALDAKQDVIETGNLSNSNNAPYLYRRSGGGLTIGNRARLKLVGATIANNQKIKMDTDWVAERATTSYADGVRAFIANDTNGQIYQIFRKTTNHTYLLVFDAKSTGNYTIKTEFYGAYPKNWSLTSSWQSFSQVFKEIYAGTVTRLYFIDTAASDWAEISLRNIMLVDITLMFGSTIADYVRTLETQTAGSGIAWLKSYGFFGKYAPYDAGSLISTKTEKKKVVGFNLWDEEWEVGSINTSNGQNTTGNAIRSKNMIPVHILGSTAIYFKIPISYIYQYDINGAFIGVSGMAGNASLTFTNENVAFLRFATRDGLTTYNNNICINYNKTTGTPKNGDYVKHTSQVYDLGGDELQGLFKLDANNNIVAEGDTKVASGLITRKYGIVDLGTINFAYDSTSAYFYTTAITRKYGANIVCLSDMYFDVGDKSAAEMASAANLSMASNNNNVNIKFKNTAYSDAAAFKTAMSGVYLLYPLATPTTEQGTPFQDPQEVFADGIEEFVDTRTVPVPVGHETEYPGTTYLASKLGDETVFTEFAPEVPPAPVADGTYVLQVEVSEGTPFYRWISASELAGE